MATADFDDVPGEGVEVVLVGFGQGVPVCLGGLNLGVPHALHDAAQVRSLGEKPQGVGVSEVVHAAGVVDATGLHGRLPDPGAEGVA
jgi:hypothetical protein